MQYLDNVRRGFRFLLSPGSESNVNFGIKDALLFYYQLAIISIILFLVFAFARLNYGPVPSNYYSSISSTIYNWELAFSPGIAALFLNVYGPRLFGVYTLSLSNLWVMAYGAIVLLGLVPIGMFIDAALYHLIGKRFLNIWNGSYSKTFAATMFGTLPLQLFYWFVPIPYLVWVGALVFRGWSIVALVISLATLQKSKRVHVFVILFFTLLLLLAILFLFSLGVFSGASL